MQKIFKSWKIMVSISSFIVAALAFAINISELRYSVTKNEYTITQNSSESLVKTTPEDCKKSCLNGFFCKAWLYKKAAGEQQKTCWLYTDSNLEFKEAEQNIGGMIRWKLFQ